MGRGLVRPDRGRGSYAGIDGGEGAELFRMDPLGGQAVIEQVTAEGVHEGGRPADIAVGVGGHAQGRE